MSYLVVLKDKTPLAYSRNNAVECAMRTLCKISGKSFYMDDNIMICKCPDREGDMTLVTKFYEHYPIVIPTSREIYDENEAAKYWLETLGGKTISCGYGLVEKLCYDINMTFSVIPDKFV